jgi:putative transposase
VSVTGCIAEQRTLHRVPHTIPCALLGVSLSWFDKWLDRTSTPTEQRRARFDAAVAEAFTTARGRHGSPRLHADLREAGWQVAEKTVAASMRRQGLAARRIRRRSGRTGQDRTAPKFGVLLRRDFTARVPNCRWVGE